MNEIIIAVLATAGLVIMLLGLIWAGLELVVRIRGAWKRLKEEK